MGLVDRKKQGNKILAGSKLNVPGQGIASVKIQSQDKPSIKSNKQNTNN
jgi:hypothetical protein